MVEEEHSMGMGMVADTVVAGPAVDLFAEVVGIAAVVEEDSTMVVEGECTLLYANTYTTT